MVQAMGMAHSRTGVQRQDLPVLLHFLHAPDEPRLTRGRTEDGWYVRRGCLLRAAVYFSRLQSCLQRKERMSKQDSLLCEQLKESVNKTPKAPRKVFSSETVPRDLKVLRLQRWTPDQVWPAIKTQVVETKFRSLYRCFSQICFWFCFKRVG